MVGTQDDPGLMVLSLHTVFELIKKDSSSDEFEVNCSYLEVYNEVGNTLCLPKLVTLTSFVQTSEVSFSIDSGNI